MIIGVPKEIYPGDRRVALVPMVIPTLTKAGFEVVVETGCGPAGRLPGRPVRRKGRANPDQLALRCLSRRTSLLQVLCLWLQRRHRQRRSSPASARTRC